MKRCKRCDILIMDDTSLCPLCNSVLDGDEPGENIYPRLEGDYQRFVLFRKIIYFILIAAAVLSVLVNYLTFHGFYWSIIVLGAIGYCFFTIRYTVMNRTNLGAKVIFQAAGILILTWIIDMVTGYTGWSIRYAIPAMLLLADMVLVAMMIFNSDRWQGYFMCQLAVTVLSVIPVVLAFMGIVDNMNLAIITCAVLWLILAATVIFGGRKVNLELKRRFHI